MRKQRVLITVKTYPTLSRKYGETVCTAGIREDGSWVRLYPVPFRRLDEVERYSKFDWIECHLQRNQSDPRPETYRPLSHDDLQPIDRVGTARGWRDRRRLVLETAKVYDRIADVVAAAKANQASLAVFKPARVLDFRWEAEDREWDPIKLREMRARSNQRDLFDDKTWRTTFKVIRKLPYAFSYRFEDADARASEMQVLDWEVGALYWNCLRASDNNEPEALARVRQKCFDAFIQTDLHFFLGTTLQFHFVAPNPWVIVGVFPIPDEQQPELLAL